MSVHLSADNKKQLWIPGGFAHGVLTLSDTAEMLYKTTQFYSRAHERSIRWDDKDLAIDWPVTRPVLLSDKDEKGSHFKDCDAHKNQ